MDDSKPLDHGPEYHVASFVLHVNAAGERAVGQLTAVEAALEIHAVEQGKMVVTAEAEHTRDLANLADRLSALPGVLQLSPVYHEFDAAPDTEHGKPPPEESPWT